MNNPCQAHDFIQGESEGNGGGGGRCGEGYAALCAHSTGSCRFKALVNGGGWPLCPLELRLRPVLSALTPSASCPTDLLTYQSHWDFREMIGFTGYLFVFLLHASALVCTEVHVHICICIWRPEVTLECSPSGAIHHLFKICSHWPRND